MEVIAHRGFWKKQEEKNSRVAFLRALENGFGIETDIRDFDKTLVVSHDMADGRCLPVSELFMMVYEKNADVTLALNIKADGLCGALNDHLAVRSVKSFVFDMSIPDTLGYLRLGFHTYVRQSEYEPVPAFYDKAAGIWLDCFERDWFDHADIMQAIDDGKKVCVVSPELHKRDHTPLWHVLRDMMRKRNIDGWLAICTDFPEEARRFFSGAS